MINYLRNLPNTLFSFKLYDNLVQQFGLSGQRDSRLFSRIGAGLVTGFTALLISYPLDIVRMQLTLDLSSIQVQQQYAGFKDCFQQIIKHEGIKQIYKGFLFSTFSLVPTQAITLMSYDYIHQSQKLNRENNNEIWQNVFRIGTGTTAALVSVFLTYPLDTIKQNILNSGMRKKLYFLYSRTYTLQRRRLQTNGSINFQQRYNGAFDCAKQIIQTEGVTGFYQGSALAILKIIPSFLVHYEIYDIMKNQVFDISLD